MSGKNDMFLFVTRACRLVVVVKVAVSGASLEQNKEVAEALKDELNRGVKLDDVLHAAKIMKQELASKVANGIPDLQ